MKKMVALLMTGTIATSLLNSFNSQVFAEEKDKRECIECNEEFIQSENINDIFASGNSFLTQNQVLEEEKESELDNKELEKIESEIDSIYDSIMNRDNIYEKYDKISARNQNLWEKLYNSLDEYYSEDITIDTIKSSKAINEDEKNKLIEDQKELDKLDKIFEQRIKEAEDATKSLTEKADKIYEKINSEQENDEPVLYKNNSNLSENSEETDFE
ncbi:hypothetical protein [Peptostreptococcus canis]|uniref:Uncharacterized protein n=1 Tax=Peptostreptococcus canis TaxID=1159213 RepID=A0ABR6TIZ0_9FIRM|nr:hypothetical protein [Peptostreptococcus canis]MBC2575154.1 hypothetical protein [Peptostreptococcus canis]MBP1997672.1 peptidoglycan hydrolase CwlO-like protein [Peptostreptococcus canis]